jgi:tRNA modification GTPase
MNDTIAAISTPFGEGAIAVLRLSGLRAIEVADSVFRGKRRASETPSRAVFRGAIYDRDVKVDEVLLTVFRAPQSYTGEDVVEISGHGGVLIARRLLDAVLRNGARPAEPGEFTQRAYLHGKMDLTQAEAVMDLISAQTDLALRAASEQLDGRLGEQIRALRETLLELLAQVEAQIDFPEEGIEPATGAALLARLDAARAGIDSLLATARHGKILREGVRTVIYGEPNVGKSSLLNLLLGGDRAIVSAQPGTTRDVIEETINLRGIPLRLVDTAGVRPSDDELEQAAMERTRRALERAELVLHVFDASQPMDEAIPLHAQRTAIGDAVNAGAQRALPGSAAALRILNKSDLGEHPAWRDIEGVRLSCRTEAGLDALGDAIVAAVTHGGVALRDWTAAINARHQRCIEQAQTFTGAARQALIEGLSPELVAEELRGAIGAIGDVVGRVESEEVLGKIFSTFCIGK